MEFQGAIEVAGGFHVFVEADMDVAAVAVDGPEPDGIAEGDGHLFRMIKGGKGFLGATENLIQAADAVVGGIQLDRPVRALGQVPHLLQVEQDGIRVFLMKSNVQVFCRLQALLYRTGGVFPRLDQSRQFILRKCSPR